MRFAVTISAIFFLFTISACADNDEKGYNDSREHYTANEHTDTEEPVSTAETVSDDDNNNGKNASGRMRNLPEFNSLLHNISGNVIWKQGEEQSLKIEADDEVLEEIITEVKDGGVLYIGFRSRNFHSNDNNKIVVFITTSDIKAIRLSGSGNLRSKNRWELSDLSLAISGSGNFDLNLDAKKVTTELAGSGNVRLKGNADVHKITVAGSGQVLGYKLQVDDCTVNVSGSGSCEVNVDENLDAVIQGSGSVTGLSHHFIFSCILHVVYKSAGYKFCI